MTHPRSSEIKWPVRLSILNMIYRYLLSWNASFSLAPPFLYASRALYTWFDLVSFFFLISEIFLYLYSPQVTHDVREQFDLLKRLDLDGTGNISFILQSTALTNVQYLNLSNCAFTAEVLEELFNSHLMKTVELLGLANCGIEPNWLPIQRIKQSFTSN